MPYLQNLGDLKDAQIGNENFRVFLLQELASSELNCVVYACLNRLLV